MYRVIGFFFLFTSIIISNGRPTTVDKDIMNLALNYDFKKADDLLTLQFSKSENLKKHFLYLNVELIKVIKETDEAVYKNRREVKDSLNKRLIEYAEKVVEKYEDEKLSIIDRFYLGSVHGVLGRLYGVTKSMTSAFSSGKEGRNIMQEIIDEDPSFIDAYLLPGMLNYYADRLGGLTEFFAGLLGLSGDRSVGLKYLEKVEKSGDFNNWQATMILIELYSRMEGNKFASLPLLKKITERFPNNIHFLNWYCYDLMSLNQLDEVEKLIEIKGARVNDYIKASFYHHKGEFLKSNKIYEKLFNQKIKVYPWVFENSKFVRVINYYMLNDLANANKYKVELNDNYKALFENYSSNNLLNAKVFEFKKAVQFNEKNNDDKLFDNYKENKLAESYWNFFSAVGKFKQNDLGKSIQYFQKAKELNFEEYGYESIRYLIHIYKVSSVPNNEVEKLLDEIDDLDNDGLEFFAQDLKQKYKL